jgi:hypothetical protein
VILLVQLEADPHGILLTPLAEGRPRADLDTADTQTDGGAGLHAQVFPGAVDIVGVDSHNGDTLGRSELQGLGMVLFSHIRNLSQPRGIYDPSGDMRGDGKRLFIPLNNGCLFRNVFGHQLSSS